MLSEEHTKPSKFLEEWLENESWWFSSTKFIDAYLTIQYKHLLDIDISNEDYITQIIIFDQLPRHIYRNQVEKKHIIAEFLQKALNIIKITGKNYIDCLSPTLWCFAMLPLRHTEHLPTIIELMKTSWNKFHTAENEKDKYVYQRFIKATYQRCPVEDQSELIQYFPNKGDYPSKYMNIKNIRDEFSDILDQLIYDNDFTIDIESLKQIKEFQEFNDPNNYVIMSFSGGVDSMICSGILSGKFASVVHINYCNRPTSIREEDFVKAWCDYMRYPLYIRRINEINRPICMENNMRDLYESYTRNVRYSTYKTVASFGRQYDTHDYRKISTKPIKFEKRNYIPVVILGHNKDDCFENICSNIAHENHYENLNGMTKISNQDEITFLRPLLDFSKNEIRGFATKMNYPFLPNSTPPWSQRGQIRANVVPILEKWDNRIINGLFNLSTMLTDLHSILDDIINSIIQKTTIITKDGINEYTCEFDIKIPKNIIFWKVLFTRLCNNTPSNKSIENLISKLKKWNNVDKFKVILKKDLQITFSNKMFIIEKLKFQHA